MASGTKGLFLWCQQVTEGYKSVEVKNMSKSWRDGLAFCAIIHRFRPDLIDFESLSPENVWENNQLAFEVAEKELGIPALLDADDMVALLVPDKLSIMTYVSQYYNHFKRKVPPAPDTTKKIGTPRTTVKRPLNQDGSSKDSPLPAKKATLDNKCIICGKKVYLVEKVISNGGLFHRSCFKCHKCGAMLRPGSAKLSPDMKKVECTHHGDKIFKLRANIASRKVTSNNQNGIEDSPWQTQNGVKDVEPSPTPSPRLKRYEPKVTSTPVFVPLTKPPEQTHPHLQANVAARAKFFSSPSEENSTKPQIPPKEIPKSTESSNDAEVKQGLKNFLAQVRAKDEEKKAAESKGAENKEVPQHVKTSEEANAAKDTTPKRPSISPPPPKVTPDEKESPKQEELPKDRESVVEGSKPEKKEKSFAKGITKKFGRLAKGGDKPPDKVKDKKKEKGEVPSPASNLPVAPTTTPVKAETKRPAEVKPTPQSLSSSPEIGEKSPKAEKEPSKVETSVKDRISRFEKMSESEGEQVSGDDAEMRETGVGEKVGVVVTSQNVPTRDQVPSIEKVPKRLEESDQDSLNPFEDDEDEASEAEKQETEEQEKKEQHRVEVISKSENNSHKMDSKTKEVLNENTRNSQVEEGDTNPFADDETNPFAEEDMEVDEKQGERKDVSFSGVTVESENFKNNKIKDEEENKTNEDSGIISGIEREKGIKSSVESEPIGTNESEKKTEKTETIGAITEVGEETESKNRIEIGNENVAEDQENNKDGTKLSKDREQDKVEVENKDQKVENYSDYDDNLNPFAFDDEDENAAGTSDSQSDTASSLGANNPFAMSDDDNQGDDYDESLNPFGNDSDEVSEEGELVNPFTGSPILKRAPGSLGSGPKKPRPARPPPPKFSPKKQTSNPYSVKTRQEILQEMQRERHTLKKKKRKAPSAPGAPSAAETLSASEAPSTPATPSSDVTSAEPTPNKLEGRVTAPPRTRKSRRAPPPPPGQSPVHNGQAPPSGVTRLIDTPSTTPEGSPLMVPKLSRRGRSPSGFKRRAPAPPPQKRDVAKNHVSPEEIKGELKEIEVETKELEQKGIELENKLRTDMQDDGWEDCEELLMEWFEVVNKKNQLLRREGELVAQEQIQQLEVEHADVEYDLRCIMSKQEHEKTDADSQKETELLDLLVELVSQRSQIVDRLEEDRIREQKEDEDIRNMMHKKDLKAIAELEESPWSVKKKPSSPGGHLLDPPESWGLDRESVETNKEKKKKKKKKEKKKDKKTDGTDGDTETTPKREKKGHKDKKKEKEK